MSKITQWKSLRSRSQRNTQTTISYSKEFRPPTVEAKNAIRQLVEKAIFIRRLTPDIENEINYELTRLGYISDVDYEALELLMAEMDAGRIQLVSNY